MALIIRPGELTDKFALQVIGENALGMFGPHNYKIDIPERAFEDSEEFHLRVALEGREKVGYAMAQEFGDDLYLRSMFVRAESNHKGVGSLLMQDLLDYAKANNYTSVSLLTSANAPWSVPFYRKFGFEIARPEALPIHISNNLVTAAQTEAIKSIPGYLPLVGMTRKLDGSLDL